MFETLQTLIEQYGYVAVFIGCIFEGEISILLGMVAAGEGMLNPAGVMFSAYFGTMLSDAGSYYVGRHFGRAILARRSRRWQARARLTQRLLARYGTFAIIGYRFVFGLRTVASLVFGTVGITPTRFFLLSGTGAVLWTLLLGVIGTLLGTAVQAALNSLHHVEIAGLLIVATIFFAIWLTTKLRSRRLPRSRDGRHDNGKN